MREHHTSSWLTMASERISTGTLRSANQKQMAGAHEVLKVASGVGCETSDGDCY